MIWIEIGALHWADDPFAQKLSENEMKNLEHHIQDKVSKYAHSKIYPLGKQLRSENWSPKAKLIQHTYLDIGLLVTGNTPKAG